ncbi:hypothetical protein Q3G72_028159 [Acer saccharum]|nr:hypothetical protein Q3G72_028159 [Acer saccharum]
MRYFPSLALFRSLLVSNRYMLKKKLPTLYSLGVETGTKFIGLSVSDTDLTYSSPLMTYVLVEQETPEMFGQFMEQLIRNKIVGGLVVGYSAAVKESERADHEAQIMKFLDLLFESGYLRGLSLLWQFSSFPTENFYNGALEDGSDVEYHTTREWQKYCFFRPFYFFDMHEGEESSPSGSKSSININKVGFVFHLHYKNHCRVTINIGFSKI